MYTKKCDRYGACTFILNRHRMSVLGHYLSLWYNSIKC